MDFDAKGPAARMLDNEGAKATDATDPSHHHPAEVDGKNEHNPCEAKPQRSCASDRSDLKTSKLSTKTAFRNNPSKVFLP